VKKVLRIRIRRLTLITRQIEINGKTFRVTLTSPVINEVKRLKNLYAAAFEDPESFEQISSEISAAINEISTAVEPTASDSDLDGLIQEIIKVVDKKDEVEEASKSSSKTGKTKSTYKKKAKKKQ
jgi:hypothetical protein